jgi:hypothetical protein
MVFLNLHVEFGLKHTSLVLNYSEYSIRLVQVDFAGKENKIHV